MTQRKSVVLNRFRTYARTMLATTLALSLELLATKVSHERHESNDERVAPNGGHGSDTKDEKDAQRQGKAERNQKNRSEHDPDDES